MLFRSLVFSQSLATDARLSFREDDQGYLVFDTGVVKGSLKKDGNGDFFRPITFIDPAVPIDNNHGLFVPYRFLTPQKRYGFGSWEWPRTGKLLAGGAAELSWVETPDRPFAFTATYNWKSADTLDFTVAFTPTVDLDKFELFVGSYFRQFTKAVVYLKDAGNGKPGFVDTPKENGQAQLFPRGTGVLPIIKDGRWKFPPFPNNWSIRQAFQAPLGIKSEPNSGVAVVIMSPPEDCFAVSMFEQNAKIGCYYLSLFGKDVKKGERLIGHARMVFGKNISEEQAIQKYQEYLKELPKIRLGDTSQKTAKTEKVNPYTLPKNSIVATGSSPAPSISSAWLPLDIGAACTSDIINTDSHTSADQFDLNGARLLTGSLLSKKGYSEAGIPDDGRVPIPTAVPTGIFQMQMPPAKNAILLSGPEGVQPQPVTVELAAGERRHYSELTLLQCATWGSGKLRVLSHYETGADVFAIIPVVDWGLRGRTGPVPPELQLAFATRCVAPKVGPNYVSPFTCEVFAERIPADPSRILRSLSFSFESLTPPRAVPELRARRWFTAAVFAISAKKAQ